MSADPAPVTARAGRLASELLELLSTYATERQIRDRPLGAHQAAAHTLADHWVAAQAVGAAARRPSSNRLRDDALALGATRLLMRLADDAVRLRGGNGYLVDDLAARAREEALALSRSRGVPHVLAAHIGEQAAATVPSPGVWDEAVTDALADVWSPRAAHDADIAGVLHDPAVHRAVAARGWLGAFVAHARLDPALQPIDAFGIAEALTLHGIPIYALNTTAMAAALIRDHGSVHLRERVLPRLLDGSEICALGYTEPNAGSDLAALTTTASRGSDGVWTLRGVKRFCTLADQAQHVLVLARSDPDSTRHRGLTLFAIPAGLPGANVHLLPTHGGERTTELPLDGVAVRDEHVVGEAGGGWAVVMSAMRYERNASPWCDLVRLAARADELGSLTTGDGRALGRDQAWRECRGWLAVDIALGRGLVDELLDPHSPIAAVAPSAAKLFCTEALVRSTRRLVTAIPPELIEAPAALRITAMWRRSISLTIAGGASEVQRDVIAAQALGLPRVRPT